MGKFGQKGGKRARSIPKKKFEPKVWKKRGGKKKNKLELEFNEDDRL